MYHQTQPVLTAPKMSEKTTNRSNICIREGNLCLQITCKRFLLKLPTCKGTGKLLENLQTILEMSPYCIYTGDSDQAMEKKTAACLYEGSLLSSFISTTTTPTLSPSILFHPISPPTYPSPKPPLLT